MDNIDKSKDALSERDDESKETITYSFFNSNFHFSQDDDMDATDKIMEIEMKEFT
jgi:hypothetical protein